MESYFERTIQLIGDEAVERLAGMHVAVFGLGGVGGYVCEALARTGVGHLTLVDNDDVAPSNMNRQIIATADTIGKPKVAVMSERLLSINPDIKLDVFRMFYLPENADDIDLTVFDYVVDAIDTITAKIELITRCIKNDIPIISAMGTGNKLDPSMLKVSDLSKTHICPLARVMRRELKKRGIKHVKVVYSEEEPLKRPRESENGEDSDVPALKEHRKDTPASAVFVPASAGLLIASEIVRDCLSI